MRKLSLKRKFYVYALLDPTKVGPFRYGRWVFTHQPFYIGKGCAKRSLVHTSSEYLKDGSLKSRTILAIRKAGVEPISVIKKAGLTERQSFDLETTLIARIGRIKTSFGPLTNNSIGGEGSTGKTVSEASRAKMRKSQTGKKHLPETVKKIVAANTGKKRNAAFRQLMRKLSLGRTFSPETRLKMSLAKKGKPGIKHTQKTKRKLSTLLTGRKKSNEHCLSMSKANKGKPWTQARRDAC